MKFQSGDWVKIISENRTGNYHNIDYQEQIGKIFKIHSFSHTNFEGTPNEIDVYNIINKEIQISYTENKLKKVYILTIDCLESDLKNIESSVFLTSYNCKFIGERMEELKPLSKQAVADAEKQMTEMQLKYETEEALERLGKINTLQLQVKEHEDKIKELKESMGLIKKSMVKK